MAGSQPLTQNNNCSSANVSPQARPLNVLNKNISWMLLSNVINATSQWGIIVAIARLGNTEAVGQYAIALAIVQPVFAFINLALRSALVTDAKQEYKPGEYLSLRIATTLLAISAIATIGIFCLDTTYSSLILIVLGFTHAIDSITDITHGSLQQKELIKEISSLIAIRGILSLTIFTFSYMLSKCLLTAITSLLATRVLLLLFWEIPQYISACARTDTKLSIDPKKLTMLFWSAIPFSASSGIVALRSSTPKLLIWHFLGPAELGLYTVIATIVAPLETIVTSTYQSIMSSFSKFHAFNNHKSLKHLTRYLLTTVTLTILTYSTCCFLSANIVLTHVFNIDYSGTYFIMGCLVTVTSMRSFTRLAGLIARVERNFRFVVITDISGTILCVLVGLALIPHYHLHGVLISQVMASIFTTAILSAYIYTQLSSHYRNPTS